MKEGTRNLLVGVFVIAAIGALGILMVWFGETPSWLRRSDWTLKIAGVRDLRGVGEGSLVNLNGVEIGRVTGLDFKDRSRPDRGVVIMARIKNLYFIPRGAIAKVYGATLGIGSGHVNIIVEEGASTESIPRDDAVIQGEMASMFGELITKDLVDSVERTITNIGDFAAAAQPVAANLERFLQERRIVDLEKGKTANITTVIERIDRLVEHVNTVLGDENLKEDVKGAVRDLRDTSKELKATVTLWRTESQKLADKAGDAIDRTEENLDRSFAKLNDVLEGINDASRSLAGVMLAVEQGKGTAGLLARDERLYEAAVLALGRFNELIGTLQQIFGKIEQDGYIDLNLSGVSPLGNIKKRYPVGSQVSDRS